MSSGDFNALSDSPSGRSEDQSEEDKSEHLLKITDYKSYAKVNCKQIFKL